jgi:DNA-binding MarR family transcriptional regulator
VNPRPRPAVLALAAVLFLAMAALRVLVGHSDEPGPVVFAPAVALFALELGALPGVVAALLATPLFYWTIDDLSLLDLGLRSVSLLVLALLVGVLGSRLRAARAVARTASQINDNVIQSLVLAQYALERGDEAEARARLVQTLDEAREILDGLVEPTRVRPGDLRRDSAARVG